MKDKRRIKKKVQIRMTFTTLLLFSQAYEANRLNLLHRNREIVKARHRKQGTEFEYKEFETKEEKEQKEENIDKREGTGKES